MEHTNTNIDKRIENWKKSLLDISKRNRLLWYKPYKASSLRLEEKYFDNNIESVLKEVDQLVFNGKTWEFITEAETTKDVIRLSDTEVDDDEELNIIQKRTKTLSNIFKKIKQESEEKGLNIGYIAVGFLEWYEREDAHTIIKTPLILIPIKIEQDGRRAPFKISLNTDEQITLNPIIQKKFETDFNIILEDIPSDLSTNSTLSKFLLDLDKQVTKETNWIINDDIVIDTFSFQNLVIWNDLDKNKELVTKNPFSRVLAGSKLDDEGFAYESGEPDLEAVKSKDYLNIYEIDSSQQEAIYRAKKGESFVIQGPPGTGKSQTITNIIAEMLYLGKKVLFVSEKQAALDVVFRKLEKKNLADFCLILHNSKAKKQNIRDQLARSLDLASRRKCVTSEALEIYNDLDKTRENLDLYTSELHKTLASGKTPYELIGDISKLRSLDNLAFSMPEHFNWDTDYTSDLFHMVDKYGKSFVDDTGHFVDNCWQNYQGDLTSTTRREIQEKIDSINDVTLTKKIDALDINNISSTSNSFFELLDSIPFSQSEHKNLEIVANNIFIRKKKIKKYQDAIKELGQTSLDYKTRLLNDFSEDFLSYKNPENSYNLLVRKYGSWLDRIFVDSDYKELMKELDEYSFYKLNYNYCVNALKTLIDYNSKKEEIAEYNKRIRVLESKNDESFKRLKKLANSKKSDMLRLIEKLDFDTLQDYQCYLEAKTGLLKKYKLDDFIAKIENSEKIYKSNEVIDIFKKRFFTLSLERTGFSKVFSKYNHTKHNSDINDFREYDKKILSISAARIRCKLISEMPSFSLFTNQAHGGEIQLLQRELKKKSRLMPTRTLIKNLPIVLPALKPCMMMSPLTVSSYFGMNPDWKFDVVIFDEASQVKPEYAITSIVRGKQVIVAGDSKQMPPTSFFDAMNDDDDEYDEDNPQIDNLESILDEMSSAFPDVYLNWHYRSKDESLIAFSNSKFYNSRLATFPASSIGGNLGVSFDYCEDGVWESKGGNRPEAEKVAMIVLDHIKNQPERSLGIVTFGKSQEYAISEAIDRLRDMHPECESFFNENNTEPFFIKNLERVQGDERDRIIISCGYGKDTNGTFAMRFGPLAMTGGERRLNVAISRARHSMTVVSSFRANEIRGTESNPQRKLIRDFIDYAEHGIGALLGDTRTDIGSSPIFDSGLEEDVYRVLFDHGYKLRTQVGSSGYKIDIAVLHPEIEGRYVLAIECDGASYHSSRTARDRDILRQKILESQGWKFHRIWSTDWYHDNGNTQKRLLSAVENAIKNYGKEKPKNDSPDCEKDSLVIESKCEDPNTILAKIYSSWSSTLRREYGAGSYSYKGWSNNDGWDSLDTMEYYDDIKKILTEVLPYKKGFAPEDIFREINKKVYKKGRYSSRAAEIYKRHFKKGFIDTGKVEIINGSIGRVNL